MILGGFHLDIGLGNVRLRTELKIFIVATASRVARGRDVRTQTFWRPRPHMSVNGVRAEGTDVKYSSRYRW